MVQTRTCLPALATCCVFVALSLTRVPPIYSTQVFEGTYVEVSTPSSDFHRLSNYNRLEGKGRKSSNCHSWTARSCTQNCSWRTKVRVQTSWGAKSPFSQTGKSHLCLFLSRACSSPHVSLGVHPMSTTAYIGGSFTGRLIPAIIVCNQSRRAYFAHRRYF